MHGLPPHLRVNHDTFRQTLLFHVPSLHQFAEAFKSVMPFCACTLSVLNLTQRLKTGNSPLDCEYSRATFSAVKNPTTALVGTHNGLKSPAIRFIIRMEQGRFSETAP